MPSSYVNLPTETDPDALAQLAFDYLQAKVPGWQPSDGQLDTWLITAIARQAAELRDVAADVPTAIFRYFGASLMNFPPLDAIAATVPTTWTASDTAGHTIPAGSLAGIRDSGGTLWTFQVTADVVIPNGSSSTTAGSVLLTATEPGVDASGLGANGQAMELVSSLDFITSVTMTASTSGGQDAEADDAYLNRLAADLALQAPRPILANDFAVFARNTAGVGRALALDGYDANTQTNGNARTVTVAVVDVAGNPVSSAIKSTVLANLQAQREVNFLVYVIDPAYTTIDVQWDVNAYPGWDPADVSSRINSAVQAFYSPSNWGMPQSGDQPLWIQRSTAYFRDLIVAIGKVAGVKDVNFARQRTGAAAYAEQDIALTGAAPLPLSGAVSGTVH